MDYVTPTTPFGRRPLSLAMLAAQAVAQTCPTDAATHKWRLFRAITEAKDQLGVSDRALAVLGALLSFHPEVALTLGPDLVVFPSNRELGLRSHGMAPATLRRHLAALVETGLIIRRDSPNGKRYARKDHNGEVEAAYGLDLSPLLARAVEFESLAASTRADRQLRALLREQTTLLRRDILKTIEAAVEANLPGSWPTYSDRLRPLLKPLPRPTGRAELEAVAAELRALKEEVDKSLAQHTDLRPMSANESRSERHYQNSNTDQVLEFEPGFRESRRAKSMPSPETERVPEAAERLEPVERRSYPLGMVLQACPDIAVYAKHGINHWRDLIANANLARADLGISPDAWTQACETFGEADAAVVVAAILQRSDAIRSPGGYLRSLTEKAAAGQFSLGPVLMALLRTRQPSRTELGISASSVSAAAGRARTPLRRPDAAVPPPDRGKRRG